jgi:hypothetical protein
MNGIDKGTAKRGFQAPKALAGFRSKRLVLISTEKVPVLQNEKETSSTTKIY